MGKIVGGFGTSHILMSPTGVEEGAERCFQGIRAMGERVMSTKPDLLVIVSGDHLMNVNMSYQIPLLVGIADEWMPMGDMQVKKQPFPGNREFAETFVAAAAEHGFDITKADAVFRPDHGITLPYTFIDPTFKTPVVPLLININMTPLAQPRRAFELGKVLRAMVEERRPSGERVAVVGTGGLSHWLFVPGMGNVAEDFDRWFMAELSAGRAEQLAALSAEEIVEKAGNGGLELVCWLLAASAAGVPGETVFYEPMPRWQSGMGAAALVA